MSYATFLKLSLPVREAFMFYYSLSELQYYKIRRTPDELASLLSPAAFKEKEALELGERLNSSIYMMFSADSLSEYDRDCAHYVAVGERINNIYGDIIAVPQSGQRVSEMVGYGVKGHLKVPFSSVETTSIIDGFEVTVKEDYAEKIFYINEDYRSKL